MTWAQTLPGLAAMTALMVGPGWGMLRLLGLRGLVALGPAATLTVALSAGWAVVLGALGVRWGLATFLLGMLLGAAACAGLGHVLGTAPWRTAGLVDDAADAAADLTERAGPSAAAPRAGRSVAARRARPPRTPDRSTLLSAPGAVLQPAPLARPHLVLAVVAAAVATGLYVVAMTRGIGVPDRPSQVWDGVFHLSAIQTVREYGDASAFGGLAPLYDYGYAPFYPTGWHSVVAVVPFLPSVPAAVNASIVVVGLLWTLSVAGLVRATWPTLPVAAAAAPVLAHSFLALPVGLITQMGQFPYTYAHVLLPGLLTLVVLAVRNLPDVRATAAPALPAAVAAFGLALVHGSAWFSTLVLTAPLLVATAVGAFRRLRRTDRRLPVAVAVWSAAGLAVLASVPLLADGVVESVQAFERPGDDGYDWILTSLLVDRPLRSFGGYELGGLDSLAQVAISGLAVGGAVLVWWLRRGRWLAVGLVVTVTLTAVSWGPADHPLRWATGVWYSETMRLDALVVICAAPLAAAALAVLVRDGVALASGVLAARRGRGAGGSRGAGDKGDGREAAGAAGVRRRRTEVVVAGALLVVLVVGSGGLRHTLRTYHAVESFVPGHLTYRMLAGEGELDLFRRADELLPEDAVVLGDRFRGTPYWYSMGGVDVVYPHLAGPRGPDGQFLLARFDEIGENPEVCTVVERLGVTHFWTNTRDTGPAPWHQMAPLGDPTLFTFRPGDGFELVATGGHGELWEITACD
ncbi:DUF6541 family protein [Georgenia sp. Z1344]|uniref:DUF6541 family protein n=1 Tax=Georgenia sp. Z1344 TaxID=3416706 RepID=UPI003CF88722